MKQYLSVATHICNDTVIEEENNGFANELVSRHSTALDASTANIIKMMSAEEVIS